MKSINLRDDLHTHSTFSDGAHEPLLNVRAAEAARLERLAFTDHVRRQTSWLPEYVEAIDALRDQTHVELICGVEAKLIDQYGALDLPENLDGIQLIQIADHSFPLGDNYFTPTAIRVLHKDGILSRRDIIESLVGATVGAMERYSSSPHQLVLAHLFSILPKIGFCEAMDLHDEDIALLARTARDTGTFVEVSERWRCPNLHTLQIMQDHDVTIVASSDAHRSEHIGVFSSYVARIKQQLEHGETPTLPCDSPNFVMLKP